MEREEAIRRIKAWNLDSDDMEVLAVVIPELAESEDEKIRKWCIEHFKECFRASKDNLEYRQYLNDKIIPWLEKQKEQKPIVTHGETYHVDTLGTQQVIAGKMPQKPAEKQNYSGLNDLERAILRGFLAAGVDNVPVGIIKETTKECLEQMGLQDPAHENDFVSKVWNKEDEEIMTDIIESLEYAYPYDNEIRNAWLKSLPERFVPQSKQKWSEEDEDMLNCCISSIEEAKENRYAYKETDGDTSYDREIDWLKSLRSQPRAKTNDYITPHKKFFKWIYNRLIDVHGENPNVDYMQSFKKRIDNLQFDEPRWKPSEEQEEPEYYQHFDPDC